MARRTKAGEVHADFTGDSRALVAASTRAQASLTRLSARAKTTQGAFASLSRFAGPAVLGLGLLRGIGGAVSTVTRFEQSIADLKAITGAAGEDLAALRRASIDLGRTSTFTADEVAGAFKLIASAKPDLLESTKALTSVTKATLTLAEASGLDLEAAANALGSTLNQFSLSASEAGRVINVLAAGSKFGAASIEETAASFKQAGTFAAALGISVEETTAAIQVLGANALKAEMAGTGLRAVLAKLEKQEASLRPSVVGLTQAFRNLAAKQLDTAELIKIVGEEGLNTALILTRKADAAEDLTAKLTGTNIATEQASDRTSTLSAKVDELKSAWAGLVLTIESSPGTSDIATIVVGWTRILNWVSEQFEEAPLRIRLVAEESELRAERARIQTLLERAREQARGAGGTSSYQELVRAREDQLYDIDARLLELEQELLDLARKEAEAVRKGAEEQEKKTEAAEGEAEARAASLKALIAEERVLKSAVDAARKLEESWKPFGREADVSAGALRRTMDMSRADSGLGPAGVEALEEAQKRQEEAQARRLEEINRILEEQEERWRDIGMSAQEGFADIISGALTGQVQSLGDAFKQLAVQITAAAVKAAALQTITASMGGGFGGGPAGIFGSLFGGFRAGGGPVSAFRSYIVGEQGPELMVPNAAGAVVANGGMGGGLAVTIQVDARGARRTRSRGSGGPRSRP